MLLFYKLIQGLSKVMRSCMFLSTVDASLGRSEYFPLCLSARTFLGSVGEADAPPVCFRTRLEWSYFTHYFVLQGVSHLGYFLRWILSRVQYGQSLKVSAPFLRVLLFFDFSDVFEGYFGVVREYFQSLPHEIDYLSRLIYSGISDLVYGSLSVLPLVCRSFFLGALACPSVLYNERGSKVIGGTAFLRIREYSPCLLPPSCHD